jgi:hypothetical protein
MDAGKEEKEKERKMCRFRIKFYGDGSCPKFLILNAI